MGHAEILIVGLLVAVAGLSSLARRISIPYPIVLVVGGALFGFVPGVPAVTLNPDVVLVVFLPPLVYSTAFFANLGDMRANLRGLTLSSVGLVLATMVVVALVAHGLIHGLSWGAAFALGAIVSPTDPLAAATIMRRLDMPRRLVSVVEGEGLFNDATALVAYKVAVAAVIGGGFSLLDAGWKFIAGAVGGVLVGLAVGWVIAAIRARTADAQTSITISLFSGYAAFVPANAIGASGVLAAVTTGIYMGVRGPSIIDARTRLQGYYVWDVVDFIINASLLVLVGLQLRAVVRGLSRQSGATLAGYALAVSGVVAVTRLVWFFTVPYLIRALDRRPAQRLRRIGARPRLIVGWSGMRGAVSLAAALALPLKTDHGAAFPDRDLIIFLTFAVIFSSLVLQGLSLPTLIRPAGHAGRGGGSGGGPCPARGDQGGARPDRRARGRRLDARGQHRSDAPGLRVPHAPLCRPRGKIEDDGYEDRSLAYQQLVQAVLGAQREALVKLRNDGDISNDVINRVVRDLDLEESRLEI